MAGEREIGTGSVPIGSRSTDGDWISFREAVRMFASKEELEKTDRLLNVTVERVNKMPTREELQARWNTEDERNKRNEESLSEVRKMIEHLNGDRYRTLVGFVVLFVTVVGGFVLSHIAFTGSHP